MAIKGKGKSRRRGVSAAPKPVYVQPKRPLLGRKGFWIAVGSVVLVAAIAGVTTGLLVQHHNNQVKAKHRAERAIVQTFGTQIDTAIAQIGTGAQTSFQAFPTLSTDVGNLKTGKPKDKAAIAEAGQVASKAAAALSSLQKINGASLVGPYATDLQPLVNGQTQMEQALQLYEQVGASMKLAAGSAGRERTDLIAQTDKLQSLASQIFNSGYQNLVGLRAQFGLISLSPSIGGTGGTTP
jgi:hypothetical protein